MSAASAFGPITPCPSCGAVSSEDYDGRGSCWKCYIETHPSMAVEPVRKMVPPPWQAFRRRVIDGLGGSFNYGGADRCSGKCPLCGDVLVIVFKGKTPRADVTCFGGCREPDVAASLWRKGGRR